MLVLTDNELLAGISTRQGLQILLVKYLYIISQISECHKNIISLISKSYQSDIGKILSVQGISNTCVILDFQSKSPDLVTFIFDLSKVTVPEE